MEQSSGSIQSVAGTAAEMATAAEQVRPRSYGDVGVGHARVSRDTESLATSVEQTSASLIEMAASIRGVSAQRRRSRRGRPKKPRRRSTRWRRRSKRSAR